MSDDKRTAGALTPVTILDRAVTANASPDVIEKLMGLQERWERHQAEKAFRAALAEAKAEFPAITKTGVVDQGRGRPNYKYAKLDKICEAVDPVLSKHGLYYNWRTSSEANGRITVTCILGHEHGFTEESSLTAPPDTTGAKNPPQSVGSAVKYLQRYTLEAALGITATEDDDARGFRDEGIIDAEAEPPEGLDLSISSERVAEIIKLKEEANLSTEQLAWMLNRLNATQIDNISEAHFERAKDMLNNVIERNKRPKPAGSEEHAEG